MTNPTAQLSVIPMSKLFSDNEKRQFSRQALDLAQHYQESPNEMNTIPIPVIDVSPSDLPIPTVAIKRRYKVLANHHIFFARQEAQCPSALCLRLNQPGRNPNLWQAELQLKLNAAALTDQEGRPSIAARSAASLLPREECTEKQLRKRFRKVALARAFLEKQLGAPPRGIGRFTWKLVEQTVTTGHWPAGKSSGSHGGKPGSEDAMEQRLQTRLERMEQQLKHLELLLLQVLEQQSGAVAPPPG